MCITNHFVIQQRLAQHRKSTSSTQLSLSITQSISVSGNYKHLFLAPTLWVIWAGLLHAEGAVSTQGMLFSQQRLKHDSISVMHKHVFSLAGGSSYQPKPGTLPSQSSGAGKLAPPIMGPEHWFGCVTGASGEVVKPCRQAMSSSSPLAPTFLTCPLER